MNKCDYLETCPIFEKAISGTIKGSYAVLYCKGSHMEEGARRKMKKEGKEVPITLLPSGDHLMSLANKSG